MRVAPLILALAGLALLTACGHRALRREGISSGPDHRKPYLGGQNALILRYDANHDGTVTRAELEAGLHAAFNALDANHNGCLDKSEVDAINQRRVEADHSTASPLVDWNGDGCVDFNEFSLTARSLFMTLDRNNDGKVTPEEFNPGLKKTKASKAPARRHSRGQGHGQGGSEAGGS